MTMLPAAPAQPTTPRHDWAHLLDALAETAEHRRATHVMDWARAAAADHRRHTGTPTSRVAAVDVAAAMLGVAR